MSQISASFEKIKKDVIIAEFIYIYLTEKFNKNFCDVYIKLKEEFNIIIDKDFELLLIFDEARFLTDTSAIDGKRIPAGIDPQELHGERELKASE